ncbi:AAA family ATPase, partial [Streptomyces sp. I05A-00742]|uniref:AAA family ATPase n=1 Tax=Streptomyces sp. I05A-00742 TaxID=2732853 RepID=UPI00148761C7
MLVDRKAELAALSAMLAESARGIAGFAVVRGGTALGKTELLHSLRTRAAEHGFTVLTALGSPAEQPYPYALADQLFPELALHNEALATDGRDGTAVPPHVMRRLHCAALDLAAEQPLLLCVDDLQYADHASQQCLLYLIRRLRTARTAFVVTEAPHGTAHRTLLGELQYQPRIRRLTLAPLGASGVDRIVAGRLGEPAAERLAAGFHRLSGGNPLLLHALLDDTADAATPAPVPGDAYRAAALACVHRSGDDALAVARAVAVLGDSADNTDGSGTDVTTLLATVSGIAPRDVGPALDALTASALFHTGRPRHPVLAEALLADLSPTAHTALRAHAARALHARGAPAAAVAAQLLAGGPLGESWE